MHGVSTSAKRQLEPSSEFLRCQVSKFGSIWRILGRHSYRKTSVVLLSEDRKLRWVRRVVTWYVVISTLLRVQFLRRRVAKFGSNLSLQLVGYYSMRSLPVAERRRDEKGSVYTQVLEEGGSRLSGRVKGSKKYRLKNSLTLDEWLQRAVVNFSEVGMYFCLCLTTIFPKSLPE